MKHSLIDQPWFYPLSLLLVAFVTYGLMIPHMGFYWDDWESVYLTYLHNNAVWFSYYAERPLSVLPYLALFPVGKMTPILWQILSIVLRFLGVLFFYLTLSTAWPKRVIQNRLIGILLLVFPGYLLQPVSAAFIQHFSVFLTFSISLYLTVQAIKHRQRFWLLMSLSVIFGVAQCFMMEYFVGLEIIRPILIWCMLRVAKDKELVTDIGRTLLIWLPFVMGVSAFILWRLVYLPAHIQFDPNTPVLLKTILSSPKEGLSELVNKALLDVQHLLLNCWGRPFTFNNFNFSPIILFSWSIGIITSLIIIFYISKLPKENRSDHNDGISGMILLGCVALFAGGIPVWMLGKQIIIGKWSDRYALAAMVGAVILVVCLAEWLLQTAAQKRWLFAILIAASISLQIYNCNNYRVDWERQVNLYWQMHWRIPDLKPGTAIIGPGAFSDKSSAYDGTYIVNLLFDKQVGKDPSYAYLDIKQFPPRFYRSGNEINYSIRGGGQFTGNTSNAIGLYFKNNACVRVLDPIYAGDPKFSETINALIDISNPDTIINEGDQTPDPAIFGEEIQHSWCYFFEKADLARQKQDWQAILKLRSEAESAHLKPALGAEYLPFIEAFARTGQWEEAYQNSYINKAKAAFCNAQVQG